MTQWRPYDWGKLPGLAGTQAETLKEGMTNQITDFIPNDGLWQVIGVRPDGTLDVQRIFSPIIREVDYRRREASRTLSR